MSKNKVIEAKRSLIHNEGNWIDSRIKSCRDASMRLGEQKRRMTQSGQFLSRKTNSDKR